MAIPLYLYKRWNWRWGGLGGGGGGCQKCCTYLCYIIIMWVFIATQQSTFPSIPETVITAEPTGCDCESKNNHRCLCTPTRHNTLLLYQKTRHNTLLLFQETTHISPVSEATLLQKLKDCFPMCIELLKQEVEHIYIFRLSKCLEIKNLTEDNHWYSKLLWQWPVANLGRQRLLIKWTHYQCWKWWDWFSTGVLYFQLWYPCM